MQVEVVPLQSCVHGAFDLREGHPIKMHESTAKDLEKAGLVRIRHKPLLGKGADDGKGQPSSVSQPAPALTTKTLHLPKSGGKKTLRIGKS